MSVTDTRFFLYLLTISSRLSRFPSGNLEPNVHTSPLRRDGQRTRVFIDGIHNFFEFFRVNIMFLFYYISLFLSFGLSPVYFIFSQQNCNNGSVLLATLIYVPKYAPVRCHDFSFLFSNTSASLMFYHISQLVNMF